VQKYHTHEKYVGDRTLARLPILIARVMEYD
jgi:hypothetical protein